jgi:replicative DNA helicase
MTGPPHATRCSSRRPRSSLGPTPSNQWLTETSHRPPCSRPRPAYNGLPRPAHVRRRCGTRRRSPARPLCTRDPPSNHIGDPSRRPSSCRRPTSPWPPYARGVWLGDGTRGPRSSPAPTPEIAAYIEADGLVVEPTGVDRRYSLRLPPGRRRPRPCPMCGEPVRAEDLAGADLRQDVRRPPAGRRGRGPTGHLPGLRRSRRPAGAVPGLPGRPRHRAGPPALAGRLGRQAHPAAYLRASVAQRRACWPGCWTPTARWRRAGACSSP